MAKIQMILIHAQRKLNFFSAKQLWNIKKNNNIKFAKDSYMTLKDISV